MYHYANKPGHSTQRSRQVLAQHFSTATNGLPGNDGTSLSGSTLAIAYYHDTY